MTGRQRTIPINLKEEAQIQTDVNLMTTQPGLNDSLLRSSRMRLSDIATQRGYWNHFGEDYTLTQILETIKQLKKSGDHPEKFEKRLQLLERNIEGIMKRNLLIYNFKQQKEGHDYYSLLDQKQKEILQQQFRNHSLFNQLSREQQRIQQLENEVVLLRASLRTSQMINTEGQIYRDLFIDLQNKLRESRFTQKQFENFILNQVKVNVANAIDLAQKVSQRVKTSSCQFKAILLQWSKQIQKLTTIENLQFQQLQETTKRFLIGLGNTKSRQQLQSMTHLLKIKQSYKNFISIFKAKLNEINSQNYQLKIKQLKLHFQPPSWDGIQLYDLRDKNIVLVSHFDSTRTVEVPVQDSRTKHLISLLGLQLQRLMKKYPKLIDEISVNLRGFLNLQILQQSIDTDSLDRIKQIIVYKEEAIKVENVYNYSREKDQKLIGTLRVLLKSLLEELNRIKGQTGAQLTLDEGILQMLRAQILVGIDVESIIGLYRPQPKVVEVQKIIEKPVYIYGELEKGIPVAVQKTIGVQNIVEKLVELRKQVPLYVEVPVEVIKKQYDVVTIERQKAVTVPVIKQMVVDRIIENMTPVNLTRDKPVQLYNEVVIEKQVPTNVFVQTIKVQYLNSQAIPVITEKIVEVEKKVQVPKYLYITEEVIKEVDVIKEKIVQNTKYTQIEIPVPFVVHIPQIVYQERQVPVYLNHVEQKIKQVQVIVQKIVPLKQSIQTVVEVPVIHQKELFIEVPKEVLIDTTHFVKGDRVDVIKQVELTVQVPIIQQKQVIHEVFVEKCVPVHVQQQKVVYVEVKVPYERIVPKVFNVQVPVPVPVVEEKIQEVQVCIPIAYPIEREVIRQEKVYVDRIIEKIVEVPRVVEVQRIVEKIVVVPRIVERIVEVVRVVEKLVPIQNTVVKIVEIVRQVPVIQTIQKVKQIRIDVPRIQFVPEYKEVPQDLIVERVIREQIIKTVELEKQIPITIIKEIPVNMYRDRIVEKLVETHQVTVKQINKPVHVIIQQSVERVVEKAVSVQIHTTTLEVTDRIVEKLVDRVFTQRVPQLVEMTVDKIVKEKVQVKVPGPERIQQVIVYKQIPVQKQVIVEKIVQTEVPRQIILTMDKIVKEIHQKAVHIPISNKIIEVPRIIQVPKVEHLIHYKEIPVEVQVRQQVAKRTIYQIIKEVNKVQQKIVTIESFQQKIKQLIIQGLPQYFTKEVPKDIVQQVPFTTTKTIIKQLPGQNVIVNTNNTTVKQIETQKIVEKIVEKIIMLPQIVEVVKMIHQVTEVQTLGVQSQISEQVHKSHYIDIATQLKVGLQELLQSLRGSRLPQAKNLLLLIQKYIGLIDGWIKFPKIIQIPKYIQKIVQKDRPVLVPTINQERQAALSLIIEKLIGQIKRIKRSYKVDLNLDQQINHLFFSDFSDSKTDEKLNDKVEKYIEQMKRKYQSFGDWAHQNFMIVNSFLEDRFIFNGMILDYKNINNTLKDENIQLQRKIDQLMLNGTSLLCEKQKVQNDYTEIVKILKSAQMLNQEDLKEILRDHEQILIPQFYFSSSNNSNIYNIYRSTMMSSPLNIKMAESALEPSRQGDGADTSLIQLKLSTIQRQKNNVEKQKNNIERKLINLEKQYKQNKDQIDRKTKDYQTQIQNIKSQYGRQTIKMTQQLEQLTKGKVTQEQQDYERRIHQLQENHRRQLQNLKNQLRRQSGSSVRRQSQSQIVRENRNLQQRIRFLENQLEDSRGSSRVIEQTRAPLTGFSGSKKFQRPQPKQFTTPVLQPELQREEEDVRSSSSKQSSPAFEGTWKSSMTLRVFMQHQPSEQLVTIVMLKVIDAMKEQIDRENFVSYSPQNIYLKNFNINNLQSMFVKFGTPILNKKNRKDGCYIAPQVHDNQPQTSKSIVWTLGVIWDQLIHRQLFFKTITEVQDSQILYEVRDPKISPILKNNLIDMLDKDPARRIQLSQSRKRLSLQKYISGNNK